jgi:hypothetical protein
MSHTNSSEKLIVWCFATCLIFEPRDGREEAYKSTRKETKKKRGNYLMNLSIDLCPGAGKEETEQTDHRRSKQGESWV